MSGIITLLFSLAHYQTGEISTAYRVFAALTVLSSIPAYSILKVYYKKHSYLNGLSRLLMGWMITFLSITSIGFLSGMAALFYDETVIIWFLFGYALQALFYVPVHYLSNYYHRKLGHRQNTLIIGTSDQALKLASSLTKARIFPLIGLVSLTSTHQSAVGHSQVVGHVGELRTLIETYCVRRLYIALPLGDAQYIEGLYIDLIELNVDVVWIPDLNNMTLLNHSVSELNGLPAIHLNESPLTSHPTAALGKEFLDRSVALIALVLLSPLLLIIASAVKTSSPGPVIFKQKRHGWNGSVIKVWKFRSMYMHNDNSVRQASFQDARVTAVGRFLRRTSLDELPQLFNVLQGHMALVGPRPHAIAHNDYYTGKIRAYMSRHRIKPGITGLAQVSGCRGETETIDKMQRRVEIDLIYINSWSLWLDIKILIKTPFTLFSKKIY